MGLSTFCVSDKSNKVYIGFDFVVVLFMVYLVRLSISRICKICICV